MIVTKLSLQAHTVLEMSYTEQKLTAAVVSEGLRPVLAHPDSGAPSSLLSLIQRCWHRNPLERPSFDDIVKELNIIMKHVGQVEWADKVSGILPSAQSNLNGLPNFQEDLNWFIQGEQLSKKTSHVVESNVRLWSNSQQDSLHYHPTLSWGSFATSGRRETMEDTHFLLPQLCNKKDIHVFGIFDGHRGTCISLYVSFLFSVVRISNIVDVRV